MFPCGTSYIKYTVQRAFDFITLVSNQVDQTTRTIQASAKIADYLPVILTFICGEHCKSLLIMYAGEKVLCSQVKSVFNKHSKIWFIKLSISFIVIMPNLFKHIFITGTCLFQICILLLPLHITLAVLCKLGSVFLTYLWNLNHIPTFDWLPHSTRH